LLGKVIIVTEAVAEKLKQLPDQPGCYLMKDDQGKIIYVGKAVNLKHRVRSYFQSSANHSPKVLAMVARIANFETIITHTEIEALILECNLIKKHRPKYNISLRDDKTFPYIKVTVAEKFPRLYTTRKVFKDGSRYFGPYTNAGAMHETVRLLKQLFPLRTCHKLDAKRPCLQYHIKRCLAPCAGYISALDYGAMVTAICLFLEGRSDGVIKVLQRSMAEAADLLEFERAARIRDQLSAVEQVRAKQNIVTAAGDQDVVGLARSAVGTCVQVFFVRGGKLVGRDHFLLTGSEEEEDQEVLAAFLKQYYSRATFIPHEILLPVAVTSPELLMEWLAEAKGSKVQLIVPQRGSKRDLIQLAAGNAALVLSEQAQKVSLEDAQTSGAVRDLGRYLGLAAEPDRIECFDISHIQGAETVASLVVFQGGLPKRDDYRRYKLQTVEGKPDDFKSMEEVVGRRYSKADLPQPDLILIDGGKGQLSSALAVIRQCGLLTVPVVGLAKEFEMIYCEGQSEPILLPRNSQALYLVQRIRDEAHRFAITYHRKLRNKRNLSSILDGIQGIGPKRRKALWDHFGTLAKIKAASLDELVEVEGMNETTATAVYVFFRQA
jgi:excinuclease ABC subunit C